MQGKDKNLEITIYNQACSQDFCKGGYEDRCVMCMHVYNQTRLGGFGGMLPQESFRNEIL